MNAFDIVLYFPTCSRSISCCFLIRWWSKVQRFIDLLIQFRIRSFHNLDKASLISIKWYFNLLSRLYSDLIGLFENRLAPRQKVFSRNFIHFLETVMGNTKISKKNYELNIFQKHPLQLCILWEVSGNF